MGSLSPLRIRKNLLEVRIDREAHSTILPLRGELDASSADLLDSTLRMLETSEDVEDLILDLTELASCDSTGVEVIARAATRLRVDDRLILLKARPGVQRAFQITGLEEQLPFIA